MGHNAGRNVMLVVAVGLVAALVVGFTARGRLARGGHGAADGWQTWKDCMNGKTSCGNTWEPGYGPLEQAAEEAREADQAEREAAERARRSILDDAQEWDRILAEAAQEDRARVQAKHGRGDDDSHGDDSHGDATIVYADQRLWPVVPGHAPRPGTCKAMPVNGDPAWYACDSEGWWEVVDEDAAVGVRKCRKDEDCLWQVVYVGEGASAGAMVLRAGKLGPVWDEPKPAADADSASGLIDATKGMHCSATEGCGWPGVGVGGAGPAALPPRHADAIPTPADRQQESSDAPDRLQHDPPLRRPADPGRSAAHPGRGRR